ncbi:glutathione S-transferase C-terminal domain-containing protein [Streptomyces sp. NPDC012403]|uniref:glutathione S-transferase C-terminal domain-containing protein n=1 Tax=unclassified Streptomyces TaxID=2593676 RepID=UPI0036E3CF04
MPATHPTAVPSLRGRIGRDARSGYHAASRRYRLHLALACPHCLRIAITHSLLSLDDTLPVEPLPAVPDGPDGGHLALRPLYEASAHRYPGPATAPVLSDDWTGRIVTTHTPDILSDLVRHFGGSLGVALHPPGSHGAIHAVERLCERDITAAAQLAGKAATDCGTRDRALETLFQGLDSVERALVRRPYVLGDQLTAADVQLWVTLLQLDTVHRWHLDAGAVHRITDHPHLWAYARRLAEHPAFAAHLDLNGIALRHHAHCRGREAAGAAVRILDWAPEHTVQAPRGPLDPVRQTGCPQG